jgi:hypothetical protein
MRSSSGQEAGVNRLAGRPSASDSALLMLYSWRQAPSAACGGPAPYKEAAANDTANSACT